MSLLDLGYFFSKLLQELIYPLNVAILVLALAFWLMQRGRYRSSKVLVGIVLVLLIAPSLPVVANALAWPLESAYPSRPTSEYPHADAIVVLGGTIIGPTLPPRYAPEVYSSRLLQAARLYHAGKADTVLATGGGEYQTPAGDTRTEADDMHDILIELGVPASAVLLERCSRTTYENALFSAEILRQQDRAEILLVTGAFHMRRAVGLFKKQGLGVIAAPSDHQVVDEPFDVRAFLPRPSALDHSTRAIKEYVGTLVYGLIGKA